MKRHIGYKEIANIGNIGVLFMSTFSLATGINNFVTVLICFAFSLIWFIGNVKQ